MHIEPFGLERWFAKHEHEADIMLAESGIRPVDASRFDLDPGKLGYVIPTNGDPEFRARVGQRYDRGTDEVLFTCGTQEANFLTFLSVLGSDAGDHAVVVTPTYQALHAVPEAFGDIDRVWLEPPDWQLDPDAVREHVTDETALIVVNNPNNPTGRYHPPAVIEELYEVAAEHGAYLLCDEVYRLLVENPQPPVASLGDWGISTASLTKAYGLAGLRFGWLVGPAEIIDRAWRWKDYTTISPSLFGQHVAKQARGSHEMAILRENRELASRNREIVAEFLSTHGLSWHDPVGVNGFVSVPDGFTNATAFCRQVVEEESVVLAPGGVFGYEEYFRIGFGLDTADLRDGLARVSTVIRGH
jgi:Aspartate/tyrosine/aromatic aminotransferase